jgi:hypothetical protein
MTCECGSEVTGMRWNKRLQTFTCEFCYELEPYKHQTGLIVKGNNRTNKTMSATMEKYIKSRYIGHDGMVKCDPRYKPAEHYLGD